MDRKPDVVTSRGDNTFDNDTDDGVKPDVVASAGGHLFERDTDDEVADGSGAMATPVKRETSRSSDRGDDALQVGASRGGVATPVKGEMSPSSARDYSGKKSVTPSPSKKKPAVRLLSSDLATLAPGNDWVDLEVPAKELRPSSTLTNGQCFNWLVVDVDPTGPGATISPQKEPQSAWGTHDATEWVGPLQHRVISIRETPTTTLFRVLHGPEDGVEEFLRRYFRLETPLAPLYSEWSQADARLAKIAAAIPGVRMLRQDPLECLFSFICSSNNNIPRIHQMLSSFRETYGTFLMEIPVRREGEIRGTMPIFSFPDAAALAAATEEELRGLGLGYRAKYIVETRDLLAECGGEEFLLGLRAERDAAAVQAELIKFSGVGRKVADCVALFSLDQDDAIPGESAKS